MSARKQYYFTSPSVFANMLKAVQFTSLDTTAIPAASTYDIMSTMSTATTHEEHVVDLVQQQPPTLTEPPTQDPAEMEEFNVFRDYFGLCDVVMSFLKTVPLEETDDSNGAEEVFYEEQREGRERRDSLGSAGSEFSSSNSAESVEVADIYYSAYNQGFMSQAFTEPVVSVVSQEFEEKPNGLRPLPPSLLLERNLGTRIPAVQPVKKPQVCLLIQLCKYALECVVDVGETGASICVNSLTPFVKYLSEVAET